MHLATLLSGLALLPLALACSAQTVRLCYDEEEGLSWKVQGKTFPTMVLLDAVSKQTGVTLEFQPRAWKRCLGELQANIWDGVFSASFLPERQEMGVYPMKDGKPDTSLRLRYDSYSLFRLRGSPASWDGQHFSKISGIVGVQSGYSVTGMLKAAGLTVDDGARTMDDVLRKLMAGHLAAAAMPSGEAMRVIQADPAMRNHIERIEPPLVSKAYYLIFSKAYYANHRDVADKLWAAIPPARESSAYRRLFDATTPP